MPMIMSMIGMDLKGASEALTQKTESEVGRDFSGDVNGDTDAIGQTVTFTATVTASDWLI